MAGVVVRIACCLLVAGVFSLGAAPQAYAGSGYQGLFAPSGDDAKKNTAPETKPAPGYEGVIATPPDPKRAPEEPAGYAGLVPGKVKKPAPKTDVAKTAPVIKNAEDIKTAAAIRSAGKVKPPKPTIATTAPSRNGKPRTRVEGMLPAEYATKQSVDRIMAVVKDPNASKKVRADRAKKAAERLATMSRGMRARANIPDKAYKSSGASDVFIKEQREGTDAALRRINNAMTELKKYQ